MNDNMRITYYHVPTLDSTSSFARRMIPALGSNEYAAISADEQTGGYGRLHRSWVSPKGKSVALSLLFFEEKLPLFAFSQIAALVCFNMLQALHPRMKWPNDLLIDGKKIAGVLTEAAFQEEKRAVIVGIGLNVNTTKEELAGIPRKTTSWLLETGEERAVDLLREQIALQFYKMMQLDLGAIQEMWLKQVSWMIGEVVTVQMAGETVSGRVHAIEPDGSLMVQLEDGRVREIFSGEIV